MMIGPDYASVDCNTPPDLEAFMKAIPAGNRAGFVILRGAYGTWPDPTVGRDWHRAQAAGLVTAAYLFLRMHLEQPPEDQVHVFADNVGTLRSNDLVPFIDVEDTGSSGEFTAERELEWVHRAWLAMRNLYGVPPGIYTSDRVWTDDLHNLPAGEMTASPLWVAKPWPRPVHTPAQLDGPVEVGEAGMPRVIMPLVPKPWGPGNCWLHQYQGDAVPCPGFSHTVDLSRFINMAPGESGSRVAWVQRRLGIAVNWYYSDAMIPQVKAFQTLNGLVPDGIIGIQTFTRLCWAPSPIAA